MFMAPLFTRAMQRSGPYLHPCLLPCAQSALCPLPAADFSWFVILLR